MDSDATGFAAAMEQIPEKFHYLINTDWLREIGAHPIQFKPYFGLPQKLQNFIEETISDLKRSRSEFNLVSTNYAGGLYFLNTWPAQLLRRIRTCPDDELRGKITSVYPDLEPSLNHMLATPVVLWVKDMGLGTGDWWKYPHMTELRF